MSILDAVKKILGVKPVVIGELNRRATLQPENVVNKPVKNQPENIQVSEEYTIKDKLMMCNEFLGRHTNTPMFLKQIKSYLKKSVNTFNIL